MVGQTLAHIIGQASKIVSTATRPAGQVTLKFTCPAAKPTCPAFLYDNVFSQLTKMGEMLCCLHLVFSGYYYFDTRTIIIIRI